MSYIKDNFLLESKTAKKLYFSSAKAMPIFDYHCHLSERQILENKPFEDIYPIWLAGDHYKWRLMRNFGIAEDYITGTKSNKEKFITYCRVLGTAFGNPLYHWSQLELKEFFGCDKEINEENAEYIWEFCNDYIKKNAVTPQSIIEKSNVTNIYTTNEVFDDLSVFYEIAKKGYSFKVAPALRADKIMNIEAEAYCDYLARLGEVKTVCDLEEAVERRIQDFIAAGCRASDISVQCVYPVYGREEAEKVFGKRLAGCSVTDEEAQIFKGYLTYSLMKLYGKYNIVTELHTGAMRNTNAVMMKRLGADSGYDGIAEDDSINNAAKLFDKLNSENLLPKTIMFNLNPKMNVEIMALLGCFQTDEARGKMQYGAAWWFLDNKEGIEKHLRDLGATGHVATFIGMLTDSRSFLSYTRHQYFRRILCNHFANLMGKGQITSNEKLVGKVIEDICYNNAVNYFGV